MWEHREMEEKEMKYSGGEKKQRQELRVQARQTHNRKRMKNGVTSSKSREHEKVGQRRRAGAGGVRGWQQQRQEINGNRTTMKNRRDKERGREKTEKKRGTNKRDGKRARLAQNSAHVMAKTTGTRTQLAADNKISNRGENERIFLLRPREKRARLTQEHTTAAGSNGKRRTKD
ncbi:hypothetical protein niasHT_011300 [Heterodera trifolii]|uniref:Uncharacterized protein n=1 Tax=Heterodera trifolii TaxID=157864 RepID=A0ABD2LA00_9BILA